MGTRYQGSDTEVRALNTYIKLMRATDSVTARLSARLAETGLTTSQFGTLEALFHLGPMSQKELARKLLKSGGNMTMVLDNLERRGLVRRERGPGDRRVSTVHLTPAGEALIREFFPGHAAAIAEQMAALTPEEQEDLGRLCRKLGLATAGHPDLPPPCEGEE